MPYAHLDEPRERVFYTRHLELTGQAPAVVCVHGAGGSHLNWPAEIRRLPGATVYTLDLPGHGRSGGSGRRTIDEYMAVLTAFLDALNLSQAVIVGHSMGSAVAMKMALTHPDRVQGLVLLGSGAKLRVAPSILQGIQNNFKGVVNLIGDFAYGPDAPEKLKNQGQQLLSQTSPEVMRGDFLACDAFDVMENLDEINVPALVITGTDDQLTPPKYAQFLAQHIAGAELVLVEKAGHMVMLERPQEVGDSVARFVAAL